MHKYIIPADNMVLVLHKFDYKNLALF